MMSNRCPDCYNRTSGRGRCPDCRAEHLATSVNHSPDDTEPRCVGCGDPAAEGGYAEDARGVWLCPGCQVLGLTPSQRAQLVAETPTALGGLCEWAVGDDDAYPDEEPPEEPEFEPASQRLIADGGDMVECCPFDDCQSARFRANSLTPVGVQADEKYRCKDCDRPFDQPAERERKHNGETRQGLARKLADPDVSEPADLDGGETA